MHWKREKEDIRVRLTISTEQFSPRRPLFQISLVACLRSLGLLASLGIFSLIAGCGGAAHSLVIAGSTSVQPVMEKIVEAFHKRNPGVRITVEGGGSSAGVMATVTGAAQLGMVSRNLKLDSADESGLKRFPLAMDAIAIIVHPHNPVSALSIEQLRELFTGKLRSWKKVGGDNREVHLIVREEGSGTRGAFDEMVLKVGSEHKRPDPYSLVQDSSGGLRVVVSGDRDAIGFISMGAVDPSVKALAIEGVSPCFDAVKSGKYKLVRPFIIISKKDPKGLGREILDFAVGSEASQIMKQEGLVSVPR